MVGVRSYVDEWLNLMYMCGIVFITFSGQVSVTLPVMAAPTEKQVLSSHMRDFATRDGSCSAFGAASWEIRAARETGRADMSCAPGHGCGFPDEDRFSSSLLPVVKTDLHCDDQCVVAP
jgi:hypothetical protein